MCIMYLRSQLFAVGNNDDNNTPCTNEYNEYNSAISPRKTNSEELNRKETYPLGPTKWHSLQECTSVGLHEVLSFFCLDLSCQHVWGELYLATGILDMTTIENERCDNFVLSAQRDGTSNSYLCIVSWCCWIPQVFDANGTTSS
jgi:hypothetical protein